MSNTNIKIAQDLYAAFGRRNVPAVLELLAPDVTWGMVGREKDFPAAGVHNGKAGAGEFFRLLKDTKEITNFEPKRFLAAEDMVLEWGRYDWTMRLSGVADSSEWLHVFTIRDGKVSAWRGHQDTAMLAEAYHATPAARHAAG